MPVPITMADLAPVAGDNYPVGSEPIGNNLDNYLRAHAALIRHPYSLASASMAAASTVNVANANGESVLITGSGTINSLGTGFVGCKRELRFTGSPTLAHSSTLQLPGNTSIVASPDRVLAFRCVGYNVWVCTGSTIRGVEDVPGLQSALNGKVSYAASGRIDLDDFSSENIANATQSNVFKAMNHGGGSAKILFHRGGIYAAFFGLDSDNQFKFGGFSEGNSYRFWTEKNFDPNAKASTGYNEFNGSQKAYQASADTYVQAQTSGSGVRLYASAASGHSGYIEFFNGGEQRLGYIGNIDSSNLFYRAEGGRAHDFNNKIIAPNFDFSGGPRVPRIFVQPNDPGSAASDGDLWIW